MPERPSRSGESAATDALCVNCGARESRHVGTYLGLKCKHASTYFAAAESPALSPRERAPDATTFSHPMCIGGPHHCQDEGHAPPVTVEAIHDPELRAHYVALALAMDDSFLRTLVLRYEATVAALTSEGARLRKALEEIAAEAEGVKSGWFYVAKRTQRTARAALASPPIPETTREEP